MEGTLKTRQASSMMAWRDEYRVGIASIDAEHKELIALINDLQSAMLDGRGKQVMKQVLDALAAYTVRHFSHEEQLMQMHRFPGFEQHKLEHDKLIAKVKALQESFRTGRSSISVEVFAFLQNWLSGHIIGVDKKYSAHLKAAGVE
jgi:hemerythrin-like metal-binding protein